MPWAHSWSCPAVGHMPHPRPPLHHPPPPPPPQRLTWQRVHHPNRRPPHPHRHHHPHRRRRLHRRPPHRHTATGNRRKGCNPSEIRFPESPLRIMAPPSQGSTDPCLDHPQTYLDPTARCLSRLSPALGLWGKLRALLLLWCIDLFIVVVPLFLRVLIP